MLLDMYLFFSLPLPHPRKRPPAQQPKAPAPSRKKAASKPKASARRPSKAALRVIDGGRPSVR
ncbi:hypothetical protein LXT21_23000 [Myxococcus sp. K38C18041901]|uniref:hypothetical protein n=1 Tax=Myxococcus guangdongensis TaxID=2906760 RepID=UPI0020A79717|nr:hypothetical protein [Myxococcus guangdongensis]MCP3061659.1 hypothetical protein [Myxococcus guangdongensis]